MLETRKDLKERIEALESANSGLVEALDAITQERDEAIRAQAEAEALGDSAVAELNEAREDLNALEARTVELEQRGVDLEAALNDDGTRIAEEAARQLAEAGHETVAVTLEDTNGPLTREDYERHSSEIKDARERGRWRLANMHRVRN